MFVFDDKIHDSTTQPQVAKIPALQLSRDRKKYRA